MSDKWIQVWGQAHSALSFFYYPSCPKTYRLIIPATVSGKKIKLELSNEYAKNDVHIKELYAAKCDKNGILLQDSVKLTVNSKESFCIKRGQILTTDIIDLNIEQGEFFCISAYVEKGALRSGNLIDNVELITVKGNVAAQKEIINQRRKRDKVREVASKVLGMYFHKPIPLIQSVQLLNDTNASSIIVFGDSISQQGYWTNTFAERVYEKFPGKFTVINKSIMGNRIRLDYSKRFICKGLFGISAVNRLKRDVLSYSDCEYVIFALGTNDFLQYGTMSAPKSEKPSAKQVFDTVVNINNELKSQGKKMIVFNVLNFGECFDSKPEKEAMVKEFNSLLEENKSLFHAVYDQASLCVNPDKPNCSKLEYLGGDKLHPNLTGGRIVADNIDLNLFSEA